MTLHETTFHIDNIQRKEKGICLKKQSLTNFIISHILPSDEFLFKKSSIVKVLFHNFHSCQGSYLE